MADMVEFMRQVKRAAMDANEASKPVNILYGTVTRENPIEITLNQQKILDTEDLVISERLTDHEVEVETHWPVTGGAGGSISGTRKVKINNRLRNGEKVILIRQQEGQRYIVVDRMVVNA